MSIFYISEAHEYKSDLFYIHMYNTWKPEMKIEWKRVYKKCPKQEIKSENKCILTTEK